MGVVSLDTLPPCALRVVLSYLSNEDRARLKRVNRTLNELASKFIRFQIIEDYQPPAQKYPLRARRFSYGVKSCKDTDLYNLISLKLQSPTEGVHFFENNFCFIPCLNNFVCVFSSDKALVSLKSDIMCANTREIKLLSKSPYMAIMGIDGKTLERVVELWNLSDQRRITKRPFYYSSLSSAEVRGHKFIYLLKREGGVSLEFISLIDGRRKTVSLEGCIGEGCVVKAVCLSTVALLFTARGEIHMMSLQTGKIEGKIVCKIDESITSESDTTCFELAQKLVVSVAKNSYLILIDRRTHEIKIIKKNPEVNPVVNGEFVFYIKGVKLMKLSTESYEETVCLESPSTRIKEIMILKGRLLFWCHHAQGGMEPNFFIYDLAKMELLNSFCGGAGHLFHSKTDVVALSRYDSESGYSSVIFLDLRDGKVLQTLTQQGEARGFGADQQSFIFSRLEQNFATTINFNIVEFTLRYG